MRPRLYLRCDASPEIGMGHLVRSQALANMLQDQFEILFFVKNASHGVQTHPFKCVTIKSEAEFLDTIDSHCIVVLDGYSFPPELQTQIKAKGAALVCVVDFPSENFQADLLINHSPGANASDYRVQAHTHFAFGLKYSLLRPTFIKAVQQPKPNLEINSILICFGGSDPLNITTRALLTVQGFTSFKRIVVVTGLLYSEQEALHVTAQKDSRVELYNNITDAELTKLIQETAVALVPASGLLLEAVASGNCVISGMYTENQKSNYESFKQAGAFLDALRFSEDDIRKATKLALEGQLKSTQLIDDQSPARIQKRFKLLATSHLMKIRLASPTDVDITFQWAINPVVRAFSFQQKTISRAEHETWFQKKLLDDNCLYYLMEIENTVIGSVRLEVLGTEAIISYLVDPQHQANGYGLILLAKSFQHAQQDWKARHKSVSTLVGYVIPTNQSSIQTFIHLGFSQTGQEDKIKFTKSISL